MISTIKVLKHYSAPHKNMQLLCINLKHCDLWWNISAMKKKMTSLMITWMSLEVILTEVSQTQTNTVWASLFVDPKSQTHRNNDCRDCCQGLGWEGEKRNGEVLVRMYIFSYKMNKFQGCMHSMVTIINNPVLFISNLMKVHFKCLFPLIHRNNYAYVRVHRWLVIILYTLNI